MASAFVLRRAGRQTDKRPVPCIRAGTRGSLLRLAPRTSLRREERRCAVPWERPLVFLFVFTFSTRHSVARLVGEGCDYACAYKRTRPVGSY
jgi:hypothetical protein